MTWCATCGCGTFVTHKGEKYCEACNTLQVIMPTLAEIQFARIATLERQLAEAKLKNAESATLRAERDDLLAAWEKIFATRNINGMSYRESAEALVKKIETLEQDRDLQKTNRHHANQRALKFERQRDEIKAKLEETRKV